MATSGLTSKLRAHVAALRHGTPAGGMRVIAVYGRDGASATLAFLAEILKTSGERVGVVAQDYIEIAGERAMGSDQAQPLEDVFKLQALLAQMKGAKCTHVLIELAGTLPTHGFAGVPFAMLVARRITDDRLDQVSNTGAIIQVKKLARHTNGYMVLPRDDHAFDDIRELAPPEGVMGFGTHANADSQITNVQLHPKGCAVTLTIDHQTELELTSRHTSKQAIYNITTAATAAYMLHIPLETIEEGVAKVPVQPATCEYLPIDRPYKLVLDSSVTPQGIAEVLESLKHFAKNRLIAVVGSNLAQPAAWRSVVGEVVAASADRIIITDGEYLESESAQTVRNQIQDGIIHAGAEAIAEEVPDRQEAIEKALALARRGDTIVICSVVTRPYRVVGADRLEWSDRNVINQLV